jgi:hypothetical protein
MADREELTPEEKLLEVIQKGDTSAPRSTSVTSSTVIGDEPDSGITAKSSAFGETPVSLQLINRILVFATLVAIGFSAYEIYANIPKEEKTFAVAELDISAEGDSSLVSSLSDTLNMFDHTRITGLSTIGPSDSELDEGTSDGPKGWRAYVRDNFKVLARSKVEKAGANGRAETVVEAIVMDTKLQKMYFFQVGQNIIINDKSVQVDKISDKTVELVCETEHQIFGDTANK